MDIIAARPEVPHMFMMAERALEGFEVDGPYAVVEIWESGFGLTNVSREEDGNSFFPRVESVPRRTTLHAWMDEVRRLDPFQFVSVAGVGGRLFIRTAPRSMVFIELDGTPQTGYTPRFADGTDPREVETCCDGCGADLSETMVHDTSDDDTRQYVVCEPCGRKYRIRSEYALTTPSAIA
jgi:hypothetical protein